MSSSGSEGSRRVVTSSSGTSPGMIASSSAVSPARGRKVPSASRFHPQGVALGADLSRIGGSILLGLEEF